MKVNVYPSTAVSMFDRVLEKNTDQRGGSNPGSDQKKKKDTEENTEYEATAESIQKAIDDFSSNDVNVSHGISAIQEGSGPGLKVTLRDSSGGVLRSVTGEEFLRLREAIQAGSKSGRILDQKV